MKNLRNCFLLLAGICLILSTSGCGSKTKSPESITIEYQGETTDSIEILNGSEDTVLTCTVTPSDYTGEIVWSSEDAGMVKISASDGNECTLSAKKTGTCKVYAKCGDTEAFIRVTVQKDQENLTGRDTALTVNGTAYSSEYCSIYYAQMYYDFVNAYGDNALDYGLDPSLGIESLESQSCDYSDDGTWYGYFLSQAVSQIPQVQALCDYASENGITLTEDQQSEIEEKIADLTSEAADLGYDTLDAYLNDYFGTGITSDMYRDYLEKITLAEGVYNEEYDSLSYTEEELSEHYVEMGYTEGDDAYPTANMRHILILAEDSSDEAIEAAHEKAEALYEEWKSGEMTEDSFAELAEANTEDPGSKDNGGLYTDIYDGEMVEGINDWLFEDGREEGDTAVIDNNGSYVGTHIVYFTGYGADYCDVLAEDDLKDTDMTEWLAGIQTDDYAVEDGMDYESIGKKFR